MIRELEETAIPNETTPPVQAALEAVAEISGTNPRILQEGIEKGIANSILIKKPQRQPRAVINSHGPSKGLPSGKSSVRTKALFDAADRGKTRRVHDDAVFRANLFGFASAKCQPD